MFPAANILHNNDPPFPHIIFISPSDNLFFSNDPPRREEDVRERLQEAVDRLLDYPPPLLKKIIGDERFQTGTVTIVEGLQCRELNKQLFFKLLDLIVLELFPELGEAGLTNDGGD